MLVPHGDPYVESVIRIRSGPHWPQYRKNKVLRPKLPVRNVVIVFDQMGDIISYEITTAVLIKHKESNRLVHDLDRIFIGYENKLGEFINLSIELERIKNVAVP